MRARTFAAPVLALVLAAGCESGEPTGVESTVARAETSPLDAVVQQSSIVTQFAAGPVIPGASATLKISSDGVGAWFDTYGLTPGHVYTLWMVVFNNPENCMTPNACVLADALSLDPAIAVDLINTGGHVVGGTGSATFAGRVKTGELGIRGIGLLDPIGAAIHLVVRNHGPKLPGSAQIKEFNGGCPPNNCANVQDAAQF